MKVSSGLAAFRELGMGLLNRDRDFGSKALAWPGNSLCIPVLQTAVGTVARALQVWLSVWGLLVLLPMPFGKYFYSGLRLVYTISLYSPS